MMSGRVRLAIAGAQVALLLALPSGGTAQSGDPTPPFSITGDTFLAIQVTDDSAAAAWYASRFGLEEVNRLTAGDGRYSIRLLTGRGLTVEVIRLPDVGPAEDGPRLGLFKAGFWVDEIDAAHDWLVERGVDADERIFVDEALGARSFVFRDLEGNRLQVFERCDSDCE